MFTAGPESTAEGDTLFASHARWMEKTHHKDGKLALLNYNFAKGPEFTNPLDPSSNQTRNTVYVINEVYENPEGLADHWKQGQENWSDFSAFMTWAAKVKVTVMHGGPVEHSLW